MIKLISKMKVATMIRLSLTGVALYYVYLETHAAVLVAVLVMLCASHELSAILHQMHTIKFELILNFAKEIQAIRTDK